MKFLGTTLMVAAVMASTVLAAASEPSGNSIHAPALRRSMHHQKRKCSSGSKKHHHKSKHHNKSSGGGSSSSSSSSSGSDTSTNNDSSGSSSTSSSSGTTPSGTGRSLKLSSKQGLAWPNSNGMKIENFLSDKVSWYYSWSAQPGWSGAPIDDTVYCPMLWGSGGSGGNVDEFKKNVLDNPNGKFNKWKCMMAPNEVNQKGQSDMSPSETCSLLRKYMMPLADQGWYFIGPSTTSAPAGLTQWYAEFKKDCPDVFNRLDAISVHWYDVSIKNFKSYVENWYKKMGKPLWITEFACQNFNGGAQCSKDDATAMMKEMSDWFIQQDYVVAFSPFGVMQNLQGVSEVNRLSNGNNPTNLYRVFADAI